MCACTVYTMQCAPAIGNLSGLTLHKCMCALDTACTHLQCALAIGNPGAEQTKGSQ